MGQRKPETVSLYHEILSVVNGKVLVIHVERFARKNERASVTLYLEERLILYVCLM